MQVLERWKPTANHLFSSTRNALLSVYVPGSGASEPHSDQDGLNGGWVELNQHLSWQLELLQLPQEVHPPLGLFDAGADGRFPLKG